VIAGPTVTKTPVLVLKHRATAGYVPIDGELISDQPSFVDVEILSGKLRAPAALEIADFYMVKISKRVEPYNSDSRRLILYIYRVAQKSKPLSLVVIIKSY